MLGRVLQPASSAGKGPVLFPALKRCGPAAHSYLQNVTQAWAVPPRMDGALDLQHAPVARLGLRLPSDLFGQRLDCRCHG